MDFVDKPTGTASPNFSLDPLVTEAESKQHMEQNPPVESATDPPEGFDVPGDGMEGMAFDEFLLRESEEQRELPPLF